MSDVTRRMAKRPPMSDEAKVKATPKSLDDIVLEAVDKCSPATDGQRFCHYNIIETAAKDYSKASHDKLLEALKELVRVAGGTLQGYGILEAPMRAAEAAIQSAKGSPK